MKIKLREIGDFASLTVGSIIHDADCGEDLCMYSLPKIRSTNGKIDYLLLSLVDADGIFYTYEVNPLEVHNLFLVTPDNIQCGVTKMMYESVPYLTN